jgi:hypothetical protein
LLALDQQSKMPGFQPGLVSDEDFPLLVQMYALSNRVSFARASYDILLALTLVEWFYAKRSQMFSDLLKFYDDTTLYSFKNFTIQEGINKTIDRSNVAVSITTSSM